MGKNIIPLLFGFSLLASASYGADFGDGFDDDFASATRPWTPANISVAAWYDAADVSTITQSSGAVSQWNDKSGNGRHVSQAVTNNRPTLSGQTILFDGVSQHLFNTTPFMYANGSIDVYVVGAISSATPDRRLLAEGYSLLTSTMYDFQNNASFGTIMSMYLRTDANTVRLSNAAQLSGTGAIDNTTKIYQWRDTGSAASGRVSGGAETTVSYTRSGAVTLNRFAIGGVLRGSFSGGIDCDIHEIIISNVLSDSERQKVEGYLAHKWGMASSLPTNHPYKATQPYQ